MRKRVRRMRDPLVGFAWDALHERYDTMCSRFQPHSPHLEGLGAQVRSDRALYHLLCARFRSSEPRAGIEHYEAMLYWKLYAIPQALGNLRVFLRANPEQRTQAAGRFAALVTAMPSTIERDVDEIVRLIEYIGSFDLLGMKSPTALPMRTTFLHFCYPSVVPILDRMVLQAVGGCEDDANHDIRVLREYVPFAWNLAERHISALNGFAESSVRLIDMALWIVRGQERHRTTGCAA